MRWSYSPLSVDREGAEAAGGDDGEDSMGSGGDLGRVSRGRGRRVSSSSGGSVDHAVQATLTTVTAALSASKQPDELRQLEITLRRRMAAQDGTAPSGRLALDDLALQLRATRGALSTQGARLRGEGGDTNSDAEGPSLSSGSGGGRMNRGPAAPSHVVPAGLDRLPGLAGKAVRALLAYLAPLLISNSGGSEDSLFGSPSLDPLGTAASAAAAARRLAEGTRRRRRLVALFMGTLLLCALMSGSGAGRRRLAGLVALLRRVWVARLLLGGQPPR